MDLLERCIYMAIGGIIGFILGVIVTRLREMKEDVTERLDEMKEELDEVDQLLKDDLGIKRDEDGFVSKDLLKKLALPLVVLLVAYSAFASQKASNRSDEAVKSYAKVGVCNKEFLNKTIRALNERTQFAQAATLSNVHLQAAQAKFFGLLLERPPRSEMDRRRASEVYFDELNNFLAISRKSAKKVAENAYPTNREFADCLNKKEN